MSLPVRRPPSRSQLSSPHCKQSPSPSYSDATPAPQKQTPEPFKTPTKTATMSQPVPSSSPLSSPPTSSPETVTPPGSSPPTLLSPGTPTRLGSPFPERSGTATETSAAETATQVQPSTSTTSNMARKRTQQPVKKRSREDDDEEDSPPPKKAASASKAKAKGKSALQKPAAKKAAPPPPPPSTRPSRNRKAPERFELLQEAETLKATPAKKAPTKSKVFDPVFITTNSTSRLGKADVYHMLLEPAAWASLSIEQQTTLMLMLPQDAANTALLEKIKSGKTDGTRPQAFHMSNDCFRTDVAKFKEDLKNGHLAKTWQAAAEQAIIERAAGEYDAWKAEESELWWGQKAE